MSRLIVSVPLLVAVAVILYLQVSSAGAQSLVDLVATNADVTTVPSNQTTMTAMPSSTTTTAAAPFGIFVTAPTATGVSPQRGNAVQSVPLRGHTSQLLAVLCFITVVL